MPRTLAPPVPPQTLGPELSARLATSAPPFICGGTHHKLAAGTGQAREARYAAAVVCGREGLWTAARPPLAVEDASVIDGEEVLRLLGAGAVLSHETAARLHGIALLEDDGTERVTVPRSRNGRGVAGWQVHRSDIPKGDVEARQGVRCTSAARTLADLARVLPHVGAVCAMDAALREGVLEPEDVMPLARARGRGARALRAVAAACDPKSGSVLESLLRLALAAAELPSPRTQYRIHDHEEEVARVDFCWPEHRLVVEADGYAFHSSRDDYRRDRRRMNELERLGWRVLRFSWEDVTQRPEHVTGLVRACLVRTAA